MIAETFADVQSRRTEWLWQGWFPLGALSLIGGPPGTAKSMLSVWLAAKTSKGELAGDWRGKPRNVLIVSSEDDLADTVRPRFEAAGGNVHRAFFMDPAAVGLEMPGSLDEVRDFLVSHAIGLMVLDPVAARLSGGLNANNDKDVRRALEPLAGLMRDFHMAGIGITHMRKATTVDAVNAMIGSMAFVGLARSVVATQEDDDGSFLWSSAKLNLGRKPESLKYEVVSDDVAGEDGEIIETARVRWMGATDRSVDDLLLEKAAKLAGRPIARRATALESAADFLKAQLATGPRLQRDVAEAAKAAGHSGVTLSRAKASVGIVSRKTRDGWTWEIRHPYDMDAGLDDLPE